MERNLLKTLPEFFKNRKQRTLFQWHNWGGGVGGGGLQVVRVHHPEKIAVLYCPFPKMSFSFETLL